MTPGAMEDEQDMGGRAQKNYTTIKSKRSERINKRRNMQREEVDNKKQNRAAANILQRDFYNCYLKA